jgi:hypothetical protein
MLSRMKRALAVLAVLELTQCNSPPAPPPVPPATPPPAETVPLPLASVAPPPVIPPATPRAPEPPPLRLVAAGAAIVWTADPKARGGFRSALVEPGPGGTKVVAERPEVVLASSKELWVLRVKKAHVTGCGDCDKCATDPPTCKKNQPIDVDEPSLQSLRSGRVLEPWSQSFVFTPGCTAAVTTQGAMATLTGAVGPVFFAEVSTQLMGCGAAHPMSSDEPLAFDLDTEKAIKPTIPAAAKDDLAARAHKALTAEECASDPKEAAAPFEVTAAYGEGGALHGVYAFTMSAPYMCGTGPGHYSVLDTQTSPWLPAELAPYGKLPPFVASFMAEKKAAFAMPIAAARVADAEKEFAKH